MAGPRKNKVLWGLLAFTLAATAWVSVADAPDSVAARDVPKPATAVERGKASQDKSSRDNSSIAKPAAAEDGWGLNPTKRAPIVGEPQDLFALEKPVEQPSQAGKDAPAVEVPALPYSYAGKLAEGDRLVVFLMRGNRNHALTIGDVVDRVWRLEAIEPARLLFSHIPTQTEVPLLIGERS
jgi:hypothetical protein